MFCLLTYAHTEMPPAIHEKALRLHSLNKSARKCGRNATTNKDKVIDTINVVRAHDAYTEMPPNIHEFYVLSCVSVVHTLVLKKRQV